MLYRIVANSRRKGDIVALAMQRFKAFDVWEGATYRDGKKEYAVVLEISSTDVNLDIDVRTVAYSIQAFGRPVEVQVLESTSLKPLAPVVPKVLEGGSRTGKSEANPTPKEEEEKKSS